MRVTVLGAIFLVVSLISLAVQVRALTRLTGRQKTTSEVERVAYRGLLRTSVCRVAAAVLYVAVGVATVTIPPETGVVALVSFILVQLLWQANAVADVRLRRRLERVSNNNNSVIERWP